MERPPLRPSVPAADVLDAAQVTLDLALGHHVDPNSDETFVECRVCGEWEGHTDGCFIPALHRWLNDGAAVAVVFVDAEVIDGGAQ